MPIFRYQCKACEAEFELLLARFDSDAECPVCGSADLEKAPNRIGVISAAAPNSCAMKSSCPGAGSRACGCGTKCCGHSH